jgi:hypothetical protein
MESLPPAALPHADHTRETPAPPAVLEAATDSEIVRVAPQDVLPPRAPTPAEDIDMPRNAPQIPRVALELPPDSGLVLVETTHTASTVADETEQRQPRRVRPPRAQIADEPLQMVETTHKDLTPPE